MKAVPDRPARIGSTMPHHNLSRWHFSLPLGAVVLAAVVTGCAGGATTEVAPEVDVQVPQATAPAQTLTARVDPSPVEPTPDDPVDPSPDDPVDPRPTLTLPGLPVGGATNTDLSADPTVQCVPVTWVADPEGPAALSTGVVARITGFDFTPRAFAVTDSGCAVTLPSCVVGLVFTEATPVCVLAADLTDPAAVHPSPFVVLIGEADCRDVTPVVCERFKRAADAQAGRADLSPLFGSSSDETDDPGPDPSGNPAEDPSGDPAPDPSGEATDG